MYVPNYIPQPVEIPGNVSTEPWGRKLDFLRRVIVWHLLSVVVVAALTQLPMPNVGGLRALEGLVAALAFLCIVRIGTRNTPWDFRASLVLCPIVLLSLAQTLRTGMSLGLPVWSPVIGLMCAALYSVFCGRDFSFVGQYFLSLVVSEVALAALCLAEGLGPRVAGLALLYNGLYLTFYCYDLASLMSRRRLGEEPVAAVDLYRDILNVFGWTIRCLRHWHRHRIWTLPWG